MNRGRTLATLILAGGGSRRMGRDKATLELDGESLTARQARVLREAGSRVSHELGQAEDDGPDRAPVQFLPPHLSRAPGQADPAPSLGLPVVRDPPPPGRGGGMRRGPLAGIVAGLEALVGGGIEASAGAENPGQADTSSDALLVLAVDMPRVGPELLLELVAAWVDAGANRTTAPRIDGRWEPLCAIWTPDVLPDARKRLDSGALSPSALLDDLESLGRATALELPSERAAEFTSWNEPADLDGPPQYR